MCVGLLFLFYFLFFLNKKNTIFFDRSCPQLYYLSVKSQSVQLSVLYTLKAPNAEHPEVQVKWILFTSSVGGYPVGYRYFVENVFIINRWFVSSCTHRSCTAPPRLRLASIRVRAVQYSVRTEISLQTSLVARASFLLQPRPVLLNAS